MSHPLSSDLLPGSLPEVVRVSSGVPQGCRPSAGDQGPGAIAGADARARLAMIAGAVPDADTSELRRLATPTLVTLPGLDALRLRLDAILFDLDGVVAKTAILHARVWRRLLDEFLARRAPGRGEMRFRWPDDYHDHVDGKPRAEGVRSLLLSRGIDLPFGAPSDSSDTDSVCGLGNRKALLFMQALESQGVEVFDGTVAVLRAVRAAALKTACVSSSLNCRKVLEKAQLTGQFDLVYDGTDLAQDGLPGKPRPDCFLRAAALIGVEPRNAAVVEDAVVGVAAGRAGGFRLVIGVDRGAGRDALLDAGADIVLSDLSEMMTNRS